VTREEIAAWAEQTTAQFSMQLLPGDHFFIESSRSLLLKTIARDLA
jgi:medium-chain acyl-[acyl-carrier-protein] hydrolase